MTGANIVKLAQSNLSNNVSFFQPKGGELEGKFKIPKKSHSEKLSFFSVLHVYGARVYRLCLGMSTARSEKHNEAWVSSSEPNF
ncbi:hypothetical protein Nepgr_010965 [Nepenthes gracilis]|uniref:Uncharacterized protein n=1 Tax=Nepenthes gracilis TaxID=150966 RepID=A0AAD3SD87_NEPGR|nr:hypothetical protein Nepgr_010965 [Nepenthes gracilis]